MSTDTVRRELRQRIDEILRRQTKIEGGLRRERTPLEGDWEEDAIVRANDEVLEALDTETRGRLMQLQAALERIDRGTYGRCVQCDGAIGGDRLAALPEVTTCITCATEAEGSPRR